MHYLIVNYGKVTTELLCEMNPDVKGEYVQKDPDSQMNKGVVWYGMLW